MPNREFDLAIRKKITPELARRYPKPSRKEKSRILDILFSPATIAASASYPPLDCSQRCPDTEPARENTSNTQSSEPGFIKIDLVEHDGGNPEGDFALTLVATDVHTGWTEMHPGYRRKRRRNFGKNLLGSVWFNGGTNSREEECLFSLARPPEPREKDLHGQEQIFS